MQKASIHVIRQQKIIFGNTRAQRRNALQIALLVCGFAAIVCDGLARAFHGPLVYFLWVIWGVYLVWLFAIAYSFETLCLDFNQGIYTFEKGILSGANVTGGRLTDIQHIYLYQVVDKEGKISYVSQLAFLPELNREPLVFQGFHFPLTAAVFEKQMLHILETAAHLNVPIHDETGWRGSWRTPEANPDICIIRPGEPHPSMLLPPPKKW